MARGQAVPEVGGRGLAPWQVKLALGLMSRDLGAGISAEELANVCGLSRSYFIRAFKISVGTPPHRWLVSQRIRRAKELLEGTDESISFIAATCGFADQSHLTRTFQAATSASPAAWRRRRRAFAATPEQRAEAAPPPTAASPG